MKSMLKPLLFALCIVAGVAQAQNPDKATSFL